MGFPLLDRAKAATVDFAAVTSPVPYDRGGVRPSRGVTGPLSDRDLCRNSSVRPLRLFRGRYPSPWAASTTGSPTIVCSPPPSHHHRPAARRHLRARTSRPQMLALANSSAGRQRLYRLTDLGAAQPLHHAGVDEKPQRDLGRHQATAGDHGALVAAAPADIAQVQRPRCERSDGPHRGQREGQPVEAGLPGVRDSEKPSSAAPITRTITTTIRRRSTTAGGS